MNIPNCASSPNAPALTNGSGAAAILAAGIGSFVLALLACAGDKSVTVKNSLDFYKPTGPLSGVTTCAIAVWLLAWFLLHRRWHCRNVAMRRVSATAFILLGLGLLLTIPPLADLF